MAPRPFSVGNMPSVADATEMIQKRVIEANNERLSGLTVGQLFELFSDGTPAWLTGSSVWLPACFGMLPDEGTDFDVVFSTQEAAKRFAEGSLEQLNMQTPPAGLKYRMVTNALGGMRILHPDGDGVIDAWSLEDGQSITDLVGEYPGDEHIRCAFGLSFGPNPFALLRLIPPKVGIFGKIKQSSGRYGWGSP